MLTFCAYLFVLEGLHQLQHPTEGQREGGTGPSVAVGHLHAAVAEVALPVRLAAEFILPKDVRNEVSYVKRTVVKNGKWGGGGREGRQVLRSLLAGVKCSIKDAKKL